MAAITTLRYQRINFSSFHNTQRCPLRSVPIRRVWPQGVFAVNLLDRVPARLLDGWCDEFFADVRF